jgi:hypothetical protein
MASITKVEEEKEAAIDARKSMIDNFPANPIVAASEKAEEEHEAKKKME